MEAGGGGGMGTSFLLQAVESTAKKRNPVKRKRFLSTVVDGYNDQLDSALIFLIHNLTNLSRKKSN